MNLTRRQFFRRALWTASAGCVGSVVALEPRWLKVRKVRLGTGPVRHRFAQITDIHYRGDADYLREVVAQVDALAPDFVCFTGDLIEEAGFVAPALEILGAIRAPIYGIPGNHDHWSRADFGPIRTAFTATGGAWLQDQQILIRGGAVNLMGVDRLPAQVATDPSRFNLLMVHYPEWADRLGDLRCDLAIAGHSHGGQVRIPFGGALITPHNTGRYEMGLYEAPVGPLYVNPGPASARFTWMCGSTAAPRSPSSRFDASACGPRTAGVGPAGTASRTSGTCAESARRSRRRNRSPPDRWRRAIPPAARTVLS